MFGIENKNISLDFKKNVDRSRVVAKQLSKGIEFNEKKWHYSFKWIWKIRIRKNDINIIKKGKEKRISAKNIIIATGAKPRALENVNIDGKYIISSKEALSLVELPKKIIIIGSGAIGCEFAFYFNSFGTDVELIEMQKRILPMEDVDISEALKENFLASRY